MERFRKILVSVSATSPEVTPQSLVRAIKLAKDTGAELRVVDVIPQPSAFLRRLFHGETTALDLLAAEHVRHLHAICERLKASGMPISTAVLSGRPFVEVIQEVERLKCDLLMSPSVFQEHLDDITALGRRNLDRALRKLAKRPPEERIVYRSGEPADVITRYASEIDADVIVMGSLARVGVPGMLVGNTAERVLRQVRCSVLTIKPKNFVSPVLAELLNATEGNGDR